MFSSSGGGKKAAPSQVRTASRFNAKVYRELADRGPWWCALKPGDGASRYVCSADVLLTRDLGWEKSHTPLEYASLTVPLFCLLGLYRQVRVCVTPFFFFLTPRLPQNPTDVWESTQLCVSLLESPSARNPASEEDDYNDPRSQPGSWRSLLSCRHTKIRLVVSYAITSRLSIRN